MANLGTITYASVIWTGGDIITEAKQDNMVANAQAYDSHAAQGLLLNNAKALVGKVTGGTNYNLMMINGSNIAEIGDASLDGLLFNIPINKPTLNASIQALTTDADAASINFNMLLSNLHKVTLGGNRTLSVSNVSTGQPFVIILGQDGSGSRTATWWGSIKWTGAVAPILTLTASRYDIFSFIYDGTNYYGSAVGYDYG